MIPTRFSMYKLKTGTGLIWCAYMIFLPLYRSSHIAVLLSKISSPASVGNHGLPKSRPELQHCLYLLTFRATSEPTKCLSETLFTHTINLSFSYPTNPLPHPLGFRRRPARPLQPMQGKAKAAAQPPPYEKPKHMSLSGHIPNR